MPYSDPAWDDVLAENKRMRAALEMVASKITPGDDRPDDTWADFTGAETQQIFDAIKVAE